MSDDKHKTRTKLLNELESIKDLLEEEDGAPDLEPPLLTTPIEDLEDPPLLTEALEVPLAGEELAETELPTDEDIPVLQEAIDPAKAMEVQTPEPNSEEAQHDSPGAAPAEEQPSLFQTGEAEAEDEGPAASAETKLQAPEPDPARPSTAVPRTTRSENPFLPQHIRDRLSANRKNQAALMESLNPLPPAKPPAKPVTTPAQEQLLIDELVQRFLPEIEAALRERLQTLLQEQNKDSGDSDS